jgi:hypothetical protein
MNNHTGRWTYLVTWTVRSHIPVRMPCHIITRGCRILHFSLTWTSYICTILYFTYKLLFYFICSHKPYLIPCFILTDLRSLCFNPCYTHKCVCFYPLLVVSLYQFTYCIVFDASDLNQYYGFTISFTHCIFLTWPILLCYSPIVYSGCDYSVLHYARLIHSFCIF